MEDKKIDRRGKIDFSFNEGKRIEKKDINQVNICISFEGEKYDSKDKVYLDSICSQGRDKARELALVNLHQVKSIIGMD